MADPIEDAIKDREGQDALRDLVAQRVFDYKDYQDAVRTHQSAIRRWVSDFFAIAGDAQNIIERLESGFGPTTSQSYILEKLLEDPNIKDELIRTFVDSINYNDASLWDKIRGADGHSDEAEGAEIRGYLIYDLVRVYERYKAAREGRDASKLDPFDFIKEALDEIGEFEPYFEHIDTYNKLREEVLIRPGKFRNDTAPEEIARWQCRIGAATFLIPPTNINVTTNFYTGSLTGAAIRQPSSPKTNLGHSETNITMTLYFPNHESIWGFKGDRANFDIFNWDPNPLQKAIPPSIRSELEASQVPGTDVPDSVIDRYLSSLRGLVTQFRYAPFLPIRNEYLNRTFGISGVTMNNLTVSTVEGFPFVLAVQLSMSKFNFTPYLPMIQDFSQAVHWGKFRQYMGRAAASLDAKVNEGFLIESEKVNPETGSKDLLAVSEGLEVPVFDKTKDIYDGKHFTFYYPKTTPAQIFAPDTTDFRQPGEDLVLTQDMWDGILSDIGIDLVKAPQFNFFEYSNARRRITSERNLLTSWLRYNDIMWQQMNDGNLDKFVDEMIAKDAQSGVDNESSRALRRTRYTAEWFYYIFDKFLSADKDIRNAILKRNESGRYVIKEWEVPMEKLFIDWSTCIVQGVAVSISNKFAPLQIQLQEDPTYQHIGGGDSSVTVSMIVLGEDNLIRFRRMFQHINGLARLEQAHGVLGFLGIKNVLTSLCGIKYVLPSDLEVDTVPNQPHVYQVRMTFVDFDVRQQQREELSSAQQADLKESFGKRNPFLRLKQKWNVFNGYPDLPLSVKDKDNNVIGYMDPDWYFRSFRPNDYDTYNWGLDKKLTNLLRDFSEIQQRLDTQVREGPDPAIATYTIELRQIEIQIRNILRTNPALALPTGWKIEESGSLKTSDINDPTTFGEPQMRQYLGVYGDKQQHATFMDFFEGGFFCLGTENTETGAEKYVLGWASYREDLASKNLENVPAIPGTVNVSQYQNEYLDGDTSPNRQFESMMQDFNYRNLRGRMLKAFPTYMLWLIDEGGRFASVKLFDNFYGLNSIIDFSVLASEDSVEDTLVLRLSNIYHKLSTPYNEGLLTEGDPLYETPIGKWITNIENRHRNTLSGLTDQLVQINNIRLKPGVRIHLRSGYGSNPNGLQTVFNGTITEVQEGDIMTVICQSDAVELTAMVNSTDTKGHSGKLDGGINTGFWLSEPRDLIVRLLSMGSSYFKEWLSWGSKGVIFSESKFGIRHFGNILYEPMSDREVRAHNNVKGAVVNAAYNTRNAGKASSAEFSAALGDLVTEASEIDRFTALPSLFSSNMMGLASMLWTNSFAYRDYELFKRNIYPGNGTGIAQYMGGDMIDAGVMMNITTAYYPTGQDDEERVAETRQAYEIIQDEIDKALEKIQERNKSEENTHYINDIWSQYRSNVDMSDDELVDLLEDALTDASDLTELRDKDEGLLSSLVNNDIVKWSVGNILLEPLMGNMIDEIAGLGGWVADTVGLGSVSDALNFVKSFGKPVHMVTRLARSPVGQALGIQSITTDDDIQGYDEVSFRAQTYMKTVWDLFKVCAALLPNYIVAVRPFEDRSTVFYGKPHWLYTSGVIPVSTGIPADLSLKPSIEDANQTLNDILKAAGYENSDFEKLNQVAQESYNLKDIMAFGSEDIDPYNAVGDAEIQTKVVDVFRNKLNQLVQDMKDDGAPEDVYAPYLEIYDDVVATLELDQLDADALYDAYDRALDAADVMPVFNDQGGSEIKTLFNESVKEIESLEQYSNATGATLLEAWYHRDKKYEDTYDWQFANFQDRSAVEEFAKRDPITFAYQFGWRFSWVPVYVDPSTNYGTDKIGGLARSKYDEDFDPNVDATDSGRSLSEATDIWRDFRVEFRELQDAKDVFNRHFAREDAQAKYDELMDLFMRFLWQDPFNRAWVVTAPDRVRAGLWDTSPLGLNPIADNSRKWNWSKLVDAWELFLLNPVNFDDNGVPKSGAARRYMEANDREGRSAANVFTGMGEDITDWVDKNIGQVLGLIGDTLTGFIASIRLSLAQLGNALSMSGEMQTQANILNAVFNDSIYYQTGKPGELRWLVDNPFTREYGEPVIEIREPFQRVHFVSSFDGILHNGIQENLENVPTVVTAVSDGKYPVRVHFDKGIPPERQVEKVVETGIYWDNAFGSGLFGMFQPLLHPFETARAYTKAALGSSDLLTSKRIALSHLKEGLKNIYTGEILIVGNTDIRPYDLLYIGDVYTRMYGMVEVAQVTHHFTPDNGLVTAIVPNAIVTVNDPARWTMLSYMWSKFSNYNIRDDVRASLAVQVDRNVSAVTKTITDEDVYKYFGTQINGSLQYTQGNTGLVREIAATFTGKGIDHTWNQIAKIDIAVGGFKAAAPIVGAIGGGLLSGGTLAAIGGLGGFVAGDLLWEGWQWIKDNILDQHGCYIQFLNKDGQPMDAGLSYYEGVAVGSNHSIETFPNTLGLVSPTQYVRRNGHYRITTDDLLGAIGWTEVETASLYRDTSMYVNQINTEILKLANRGPGGTQLVEQDVAVVIARILNPSGEYVPSEDRNRNGVVDGDTIDVSIIDDGGLGLASVERVRLAVVNTFELQYKNNPYTAFNEVLNNDPNDLAVLAYNYLVQRFSVPSERVVAIRVDKRRMRDDTPSKRLLGVVFHNAPLGTAASDRVDALKAIAGRTPPIPFDGYMDDGRPYTLNWEMVMTGYGNVDMRDSLWDTEWRKDALFNLGG